MEKLDKEFYQRDTITVAQDLLGTYIVHNFQNKQLIGRIVEVEAYVGAHDLACHCSKGLTKRTKIMFGPGGHAYIYLIYGIYHCLNIVTEKEGCGSAVLIRAVEPIKNIFLKTNGPGLLTKALGIDLSLNGCSLNDDVLYLLPKDPANIKIIKRPRIGIAYAKHWAKKLLRFYIKDNPYVSKP